MNSEMAVSDESALLAAIWEHPHEDTPRLMYADWLQENGQPERAEFLRVQIEAAILSDFDPMKMSRVQHARQLLARHVEAWVEPFGWVFAGLKPVAWDDGPSSPTRIWETAVGVSGVQPVESVTGFDPPTMRFERGFISFVTSTLAKLLSQPPDSLLQLEPRPNISVSWPHGGAGVEFDCVFPALLERLTPDRFSGWQFAGLDSLGESGLGALADESALVAGLTSFDLTNSATFQTHRRVLSLAKRLTRLISSLCDENSRELLPLVRAVIELRLNETLTDFAAVNLFNEFLEVPAVVTELAAATWPNLKKLLFYQWSGSSCLTTGITGEPFPRLEELTLLGNGISKSQLIAVLECPAFAHARVQYFEDGKRPDLKELEEQYAPRFQSST